LQIAYAIVILLLIGMADIRAVHAAEYDRRTALLVLENVVVGVHLLTASLTIAALEFDLC
jgi:hypothetical protein